MLKAQRRGSGLCQNFGTKQPDLVRVFQPVELSGRHARQRVSELEESSPSSIFKPVRVLFAVRIACYFPPARLHVHGIEWK